MTSSHKKRVRPDKAEPLRVVIAGGGTGGHLFPGIAIAEAFKMQDPRNAILFVSTGNPFERAALARQGWPLACIPAEGIKGRGLSQQLQSLRKIPQGIWRARRILKRFNPDLVIGMGSYSAGPVVLAARTMQIKTALHEQNILPGITNRFLAYLADRIYVSFAETPLPAGCHDKLLTGNPVRSSILACRDPIGASPPGAAAASEPFTVLVIGGSQGAHRINIALTEALQYLKAKAAFRFIHQTGAADQKDVQSAYRQAGVSADVRAFFDDMQHQYTQADLLVCRAGATTVAEITAIGKAAIFVPYPYAADNHQMLNAQALAEAGAAEMILEETLSGPLLAKRMEGLANDRRRLAQMASKAGRFGHPEAAERIVVDSYRLVYGFWPSRPCDGMPNETGTIF